MKRLRQALAWVLALMLAAPLPIGAQSAQSAQTQQPPPFTAEQLDQLAAPIALYPDPLVAQILMASTYPLEIVNHEGVVYQKNLGPNTAAIARGMTSFDPDPTWKKV